METYVILKNLKGGEKFPGVLPGREFLSIGDYCIFQNANNSERIGIVAVPEFTADEADVVKEWGKPCMIVATLRRHDVDWPDDIMDTEPEMPEEVE